MNMISPDTKYEESALAGDLTLLDLIGLEELQHLQDALAEIGHVKSVICDPEGHLLTMPSNDIPICRIVRQSRRGSIDCTHTLFDLSLEVKKEAQPMIHACKRAGVLKAATPIIINGRHLANWWISQYCPEVTDRANLVSYARNIGLSADLLSQAAPFRLPVKNFRRS